MTGLANENYMSRLSTSAMLFRLLPERHPRIIGAGRGASFTHPIRVASPAGIAGGISIGTRIGYCCDHSAIAVDVDVG